MDETWLDVPRLIISVPKSPRCEVELEGCKDMALIFHGVGSDGFCVDMSSILLCIIGKKDVVFCGFCLFL